MSDYIYIYILSILIILFILYIYKKNRIKGIINIILIFSYSFIMCYNMINNG